jgi:hypothetical protein
MIAKRAAIWAGIKHCLVDSSRLAANGGDCGETHDHVARPEACANGALADGLIRHDRVHGAPPIAGVGLFFSRYTRLKPAALSKASWRSKLLGCSACGKSARSIDLARTFCRDPSGIRSSDRRTRSPG